MEMGGYFCQILELGGTTIKGWRVQSLVITHNHNKVIDYKSMKS